MVRWILALGLVCGSLVCAQSANAQGLWFGGIGFGGPGFYGTGFGSGFSPYGFGNAAYFGGYVLDNYRALFAAHPTLGPREAWQLVANSFEASFVDAAARDRGLAALAAVVESLASD